MTKININNVAAEMHVENNGEIYIAASDDRRRRAAQRSFSR